MNNEIRWAGRTYRHANAEGDAGGAGGAESAGGGEPSGDVGAAGGGGEGASGAGDGAAAGDGAGDAGDLGAGASDWRSRIAGDNEDRAKRLERYNTEEDFYESAFQAHDKIRKGEISSGLPENPTVEQLEAYREAQGIPQDGKYEFSLSDGVQLTEVDLEMLGPVMEFAFEKNIPADVLNGLVDTYMGEREGMIQKMEQQDNIDLQQFQQLMRGPEGWGQDYQVNMNRATNRLNMLPEAVRENIKMARMADGRALMNSPEFMNWLVGMDRELMPLDPIPGGEEHDMKSVQAIINNVKKIFAEGREDSDYWGKDNVNLRAEYQKALATMEKLQQ